MSLVNKCFSNSFLFSFFTDAFVFSISFPLNFSSRSRFARSPYSFHIFFFPPFCFSRATFLFCRVKELKRIVKLSGYCSRTKLVVTKVAAWRDENFFSMASSFPFIHDVSDAVEISGVAINAKRVAKLEKSL